MKKIIRITENDIKNAVMSSVKRILKEGLNDGEFGENDSIVDTQKFMIVADRFMKYSEEIKMFVEEYKVFFQTLVNAVKKLGLVYINQDINDDFFEEQPNRGVRYAYIFNDGTDVRSLYDNEEAYDKYCEKIRMLASELEDEINPNHFKACRVRVNDNDEEIEVEIIFDLWD